MRTMSEELKVSCKRCGKKETLIGHDIDQFDIGIVLEEPDWILKGWKIIKMVDEDGIARYFSWCDDQECHIYFEENRWSILGDILGK